MTTYQLPIHRWEQWAPRKECNSWRRCPPCRKVRSTVAERLSLVGRNCSADTWLALCPFAENPNKQMQVKLLARNRSWRELLFSGILCNLFKKRVRSWKMTLSLFPAICIIFPSMSSFLIEVERWHCHYFLLFVLIFPPSLAFLFPFYGGVGLLFCCWCFVIIFVCFSKWGGGGGGVQRDAANFWWLTSLCLFSRFKQISWMAEEFGLVCSWASWFKQNLFIHHNCKLNK